MDTKELCSSLKAQMQGPEFLKDSSARQRSNAESTFSIAKARFRDSVRSTSDTAMKSEVLCKFLAHNLRCVIQNRMELGIAAD